MKVAYISTPHFADCDIPLIGELQKKIDLFYFLKVSESTKRLTLIKIDSIKKKEVYILLLIFQNSPTCLTI